jgi:hypothetical protein
MVKGSILWEKSPMNRLRSPGEALQRNLTVFSGRGGVGWYEQVWNEVVGRRCAKKFAPAWRAVEMKNLK